jgi:hypothetical protein
MSGAVRRELRPDAAGAEGVQDAERLIALAHGCASAAIERRCLLLHLSCLPADLAKPHHLRLAREAIGALLAADRAQVFTLPNHDIAVVWRGQAALALADARAAVGRLFADSPSESIDPAALCQVLELPADMGRLLELVDASLSTAPAASPGEAAQPLDAAGLARLEATLVRAVVARCARRGQVLALDPSGVFQPAWETRTLSVDELAAELAPGRAARADPWLFARLTRTLDRRMLALLADPNELRAAGPFGLDLNVASLLAPEFLRFDAVLPQGLRGHVTLGLLPADILADPAAFLFARDFAHTRGYRLMLRLPDPDLLALLPLERMGLDLLQLAWSRRLLTVHPGLLEPVASRLLLTHADSAESVAWGRVQGIRLYAGRAASAGRTAPGLALAGSARDSAAP